MVVSVFVSGVGEAGAVLIGLLFIVETVGGNERHWYLGICLAVAGLGSAAIALLAIYLSNWRILCLMLAGTAFAIFPSFIWLPESPRFLSISHKFESARQILQRISHFNHSPVFQEVLEGEKVLGFQEQSSVLPSSPKTLSEATKINFINTSHGTVTVTDSVSSTGKRMECGTLCRLESFKRKILPVMMMWSSQILAKSCVDVELRNHIENEYYSGIIVGLTALLTSLAVALSIGRLGRKSAIEWLLCLGGLGCWAAEIAVLSEKSTLQSIFLVAASGSISSLYLPLYLYTCELFPTCLRPFALCLSTGFGLFIALTAPYLPFISSSIGIDLLLIIGTLMLASCLLGLEMPETQGKRLEDFLEEAHSRQIEMRMSASTSNFKDKPNFEQFNEAS
jgi:hypothetical protein